MADQFQPDDPHTPNLETRSERLIASTSFEIVPRSVKLLSSTADLPRWKVRFELLDNPELAFGLDIYGDVILGRDESGPEQVDLGFFNAAISGVSRKHAMLRPTGNKLYVIDLDSTNGTRRSGHELGAHTPYPLRNGEVLSLGSLQLRIQIVDRPRGVTSVFKKADLADALIQTARTLTSSLELDQVLEQVAEAAMFLTSAGATAVWLLDDQTRELRLEAQRGFDGDSANAQVLAPDNPHVQQVISLGAPVRVGELDDEQSIKVQTGFLVEAMLMLPINLGGVTIGVLGAFQHTQHRTFTERDESLLVSITDFAAIAVQNARLYQATDQALASRLQETSAVNELSAALSTSLELDVIHDILIGQLRKHWDVETIVLWLRDETTGAFNPILDDRATSLLIKRTGDQLFKIVETVTQSGEPLIATYREIQEEIKANTLETLNKAIACVPLKTQRKVTGVLTLINLLHGSFDQDDLIRLQAFANPVSSAIQNARLYTLSQREQAIINATAQTLPQPLLILSPAAEVIVANEAARELLNAHKQELFAGIASSAGQTTELVFGDETYLTTTEQIPEVGTIIIMQNITHLKQLEQARLEFVHALSHDIKSPLSSIMGYAELIPRVDELSERGQHYINTIVGITDNINQLIIQLLDVALLTEAPHRNHEPCDLDAIIRQVVSDSSGAALAKSIEMTYQLAGDPIPVLGDETRLYRSVLNLVDNAIKYSPENTKIEVSLTFDERAVTITVQDEGPGIPSEDIERLFERFYRGKQSSGKKVGYGLGLVMVQATAQAHGGAVRVENRATGGARFTITLPANLRS